MGDPIEVESGEGVELSLRIALIRIAGDGRGPTRSAGEFGSE
jgi:hypothetical protein